MASKDHDILLESITELMLTHGLKAMTMDSVASALGISKRTLYEIFDSKDEMIKAALTHLEERHTQSLVRTFQECDNVMEACLRIGITMGQVMQRVAPEFFRDMDRLYTRTRDEYERRREIRQRGILKIMGIGVKQGVFRDDVDLLTHIRLMDIQLESLKRMEELFPKDITVEYVNRTIVLNFLRALATYKGMRILDEICSREGLAKRETPATPAEEDGMSLLYGNRKKQ